MKKSTVTTAFTIGIGLLVYTCTSISPAIVSSKSSFIAKGDKIKYVESDIDSLDFTMKIPNYMETTGSLDNSRPFQYMNEVKEHYIVASYELITDVKPALENLVSGDEILLEKYVSYNWEVIKQGIIVYQQKPVKTLTIDGMSARIMQFDGMVDGINEGISYYAIFIEAPEKLYFVLAWTLVSKKTEFTPIAETMLKSFRLKK